MNQKRITNQILEQKNFTLNSTLNYLFNISNMKKLFSYLLISSMVVLSSCTNYDDQFDDLNSQINSLKSQIEGFSSLSSGLTALQGTVSSLQSAVAALPKTATPATDISGLEASVAELQTQLASASTSAEVTALTAQLTAAQTALANAIAANATAAETNATAIAGNATAIANLLTELETLATSLAGIKTDLAAADTSAEVAALTTALATAQADLTALLEQNQIYSTKLSIKSKAELDFAVALGDKITIVNEEVDIEQKKDMDAAVLQTVMNRIKTVVKDVTFKSTETGITTTPSFDNLTSAANVTLTQKADVSLPALVSTGNLTITDDNKITSVSAPKLEVITGLGVTSHNKVASYSMPALKRFPSGNFTLTVDSGTVDFSALITTEDTVLAAERADTIEIDGATVVKAPLIVSGKLLMDNVLEPNFPVWKGTADSKFDRAKKVVLPSMTGAFVINPNLMAPKATYFHYIGLDGDDDSTTADDKTYKFPSFTSTGNTVIETLIIGGHSTSVYVSGATDLTSFTITGGTHALTLDDNDSMSSYELGHTSTITNNSYGAISSGKLVITGNADITSITADSLDDINTLTVTGNASLETLSFAKLNSLGTDTDKTALAAGEANVNIHTNDLTASLIQLPSAVNVLPAVSGKITSASGINSIKTFIAAALAKRGTASTRVSYDNVTQVLDADGDDLAVGGNIALRTATGWSSTNVQTWGGEDSTVDLLNYVAGAAGAPAVTEKLQRSSYGLSNSGSIQTDDFIAIEPSVSGTELAKVTFDAAFKAKYGITNTFAASPDTWAPSVETELKAQLVAGGYNFDVEVKQDFGKKKKYLISLFNDGVLSETSGRAGGPVTFTFNGVTLSGTVAAATNEDFTETLANAINNAKSLSGSFNVATVTGGVEVTPEVENVVDYSSTPSFGSGFAFPYASNYFTASSQTAYMGASSTIAVVGTSESAGWRVTVINKSTSLKADLLDLAASASHTTASGTIALTELVDGTSISGTDNDLQRDWDNVVVGAPAGAAGAGTALNLTTWL